MTMGELLELVTPLHKSTSRDYLARMTDDKTHCMEVAQRYDGDYWDGPRRYGYGGYKYIPNRWAPVARSLIDRYKLSDSSRILDVGCGKGFLLYEFKRLLPGIRISGFDISEYGISDALDEVREFLFIHNAQDTLPSERDEFDLIISLGCMHNLGLRHLERAIAEVERVGQSAYIMVESFRNNRELFNLQCWALTAQTFLNPSDWVWLFERIGYTGDYEFIFFE